MTGPEVLVCDRWSLLSCPRAANGLGEVLFSIAADTGEPLAPCHEQAGVPPAAPAVWAIAQRED